MKQKTLDRLDTLNSDLDTLEKELRVYADADLNYRPAPGVWSVLDNLHHIRLAEGFSHKYLEKKLKGGISSMKNGGIGARLRSLSVTIFMRSSSKREAPKMVGESQFPEHSSLEEVMGLWRQQRSDLAAFLQEQPDELFVKEAYRHPFAGRLTLMGMLGFFDDHLIRHKRQIARTLSQLNKN